MIATAVSAQELLETAITSAPAPASRVSCSTSHASSRTGKRRSPSSARGLRSTPGGSRLGADRFPAATSSKPPRGTGRSPPVIAQVPFADGLRNLPSLGLALALRLIAAGLRDQLGAAVGRPPHMVASVGPPGSVAVMTTPDAEPGFRAIDPPGSTWRNRAAARIALRVASYRPGRHAGQIAAPILFALAQDDVITPAVLARAAAARAPNAEVRAYPGRRFDIYVGPTFERAVADQVEFLTRHLLRSSLRSCSRRRGRISGPGRGAHFDR